MSPTATLPEPRYPAKGRKEYSSEPSTPENTLVWAPRAAVKIRSVRPSPLTSPVAGWISPKKPGKGTTKVRTEPTLASGGWVPPGPGATRIGGGVWSVSVAVLSAGLLSLPSPPGGVTVAVLLTVPEATATVAVTV